MSLNPSGLRNCVIMPKNVISNEYEKSYYTGNGIDPFPLFRRKTESGMNVTGFRTRRLGHNVILRRQPKNLFL